MHVIDVLVLVGVMLLLLAVGWKLSKISGKDTSEFLVAGRKMPWWLIGISDIAVGLNTSSMLQESRKVRQDGVIGLMHQWGFALKGCIAGVFFNRLWRRARFKTQMEFYRSRYSGWQANFSRIYDTVIFGGFVTSIWASVGLVGMKKVAIVVLDIPESFTLLGFVLPSDAVVVAVCVLVALSYSAASGARGVYWTDLIELGITLFVLWILFVIVYLKIGGSIGLREHLESLPSLEKSKYLSFLQPFSIIYIGMFVVNPLLDHGGFNPAAQRLLSVKDEREILYTSAFTGIVGVVRGLPFVGIGLIGMFLINDQYLATNFPVIFTPEGGAVPDWERVLPVLATQYLPVGLIGLMGAGFLCAFMSSFDSNIHLAGSVLVNDLYRPYLVKGKEDHHYVMVTKLGMVFAAFTTVTIGVLADDILYLGYLAITISLGGGWIKLLRLIWWRTNGAAEVAAQVCAIFIFIIILSPLGKEIILFLMGISGLKGNDAFIVIRNLTAALACTTVAVPVMLLTKPEPMEKLCAFYRRMRPFGFWGPVRRELGESVKQPDPIGVQMALVLCFVALMWGSFFAGMSLLLAFWQSLAASLCLVLVGCYGSYRFIHRLYPRGEEIQEYAGDEDD